MKNKYFKTYGNLQIFSIQAKDVNLGQFPELFFPNAVEISKEEFDYLSTRRTGMSTRLVDHYVQELFNLGKVTIKDHYDSYYSHKLLFNTFLRRLEIEHLHIMEHISVCKLTLTVKFKGEV